MLNYFTYFYNEKLKRIFICRCEADTFQGYETHRPSESQKQYNPEYVYQSSDQTRQPYPNAVDGFTVSCSGLNQVCVARSLCIDGYVHPLKQGFIRPGQVRSFHLLCLITRQRLLDFISYLFVIVRAILHAFLIYIYV